MRRLVALLVVVTLVIAVAVPPAHAGGRTATNIALGLASFAVFNQLVGGFLHARPVYAYPAYAPYSVVVERPYYVERPVYYAAPAYAYPSPIVVQPAPPTYPTVVQYPHGRYELRGDGIQTPYQWVWIPNPPPPPAPAAPPAPPSR